jgi:N-acetylglutamate synthase-like GNAT family acetyltransferase
MIRAVPIAWDDAAFGAQLRTAKLPVTDLGNAAATYFRIERLAKHLGYGGMEIYDKGALLRSVVVPEAERGTGAGRQVVECLLGVLSSKNVRRVYLLTAGAVPFFEHLGFQKLERSAAPASILATHQASSICSSAHMLWRPL